jgi:hypothetical protein
MFSDQSGYPRPGRKSEQTFDEASADERAGAKAFATSPVANRFNSGDQLAHFGRIEEFRNVADTRATRYLSSCHGRSLSYGHAPGSSRFAGALLFGFAGKTLTGASDGIAPGGPRAFGVAAAQIGRSEVWFTQLIGGNPVSALVKCLLCADPAEDSGGGDENRTRTGRKAPGGPSPGCLPVPARPHLSPRRGIYDRPGSTVVLDGLADIAAGTQANTALQKVLIYREKFPLHANPHSCGKLNSCVNSPYAKSCCCRALWFNGDAVCPVENNFAAHKTAPEEGAERPAGVKSSRRWVDRNAR